MEEVVLKEPLSPIAENYKGLRTSLLLAAADAPPHDLGHTLRYPVQLGASRFSYLRKTIDTREHQHRAAEAQPRAHEAAPHEHGGHEQQLEVRECGHARRSAPVRTTAVPFV